MKPLIVITGPTASGKTGLALTLAERYRGEIICADSRTIYSGMDIGTAKPTAEERGRAPHHLLDVVLPNEAYSAADFQAAARAAIADIRGRGKVPFLVGGTGLYIDAVIREYEWPVLEPEDATLEHKTVDELQKMIKEQHKILPASSLNKRHLINVLRRKTDGGALARPREHTHVVAIATDAATLQTRIRERAAAMFESGVIEEAKRLGEQYGWDSEAMTSNIYPVVHQVLQGKLTRAEAVEVFAAKDWQLARRQLTWLRRYDFVEWLSLEEAEAYIGTILG